MIGASIFHFAKGLAARDFFDLARPGPVRRPQARLRVSGESTEDLHRTRESALAFVAGKIADLVALGEQIYDEEISDRIW